MTVRTCYEEAGADYDSLLKRYRSDKLLEKYLRRFLDDISFMQLQKAMEQEDTEGAFEAVHNLKGISLNMDFGKLYEVCSALTELLRDGRKRDCSREYAAVAAEYKRVYEIVERSL